MQKNFELIILKDPRKIKSRWYDCAKKFKLKYFHTIDADDPFFDPLAVIKSLELLKSYDLILPSKFSRNGGLVKVTLLSLFYKKSL